MMKFTATTYQIVIAIASVIWLSACSEAPEEETPAEKVTIAAPKKIEKDPPADIAASTNEADAPVGEDRARSEKGKGGKGDRPDWRNMPEEERSKARHERFMQLDTDGDGQIGRDEIPGGAWESMSRADKNGDDRISEAEGREFRAEMETERAIRELDGDSRPPGDGGNSDSGKGANGGDSKGVGSKGKGSKSGD